MIGAWMGIITKPEETVAAEKTNGGIGKGVLNFAIVGLIIGIIVGVLVALASMVASLIPGLGMLAGIGLLAIVIVPIAAIIGIILISLIYNLALWISAKIVGGKGSFGTQYYLISLPAVPSVVISIVAIVLMIVLTFVPILGSFIGILLLYTIMGYISIIGTMAFISALKETHELSTMNVALATGLSMAIMMIIVFILALIILTPIIIGMGLGNLSGLGSSGFANLFT